MPSKCVEENSPPFPRARARADRAVEMVMFWRRWISQPEVRIDWRFLLNSGRKLRICCCISKEFQRRNISLWLLDVGGDVSGNGVAKLMLTILSAFAEFERDRISERIRDAKRQMRAEGRLQGGKRPFGYRVDDAGALYPDEREQYALIEMRKLRTAGKSYRAIVQALAEDCGVAVDHTTVRNILRREAAK